ncbi:hypothetical protein B0H15DRAFT_796262 [Mycena belliarum]|uniref:Uncharacterized protein n=1 Tax=Mycena belliarum TaxID=1033014 RepID=A0AAD6UHL9_9AGAR|nr:hypothetical protein B0H15DRAFT_796262 [Mycena belliae]
MVCRAWSPHAQRLLFRRVILPRNLYREPHLRGTSRNSLPSLVEAIDTATERGRWLANSIVSLTVRHTGRLQISDPTALATVLLRTPNLRHLDVTTMCCRFDTDTLELLARECGPRITSLCILQDFSLSPRIQHSRTLNNIVAALHAVRLVEITLQLSSEPLLPPLALPPRLRLAALKLNTTVGHNIGPYVTSLVGEGAELQLFAHKSKGSQASDRGDVLRAHAVHLRSLSVRGLDNDDAATLALCTRLERLELACFPDPAMLALIPRSITALAIAGDLPGSVEELAAELAASAFPDLKSLTWFSCIWWHADGGPLGVLQAACTAQGIELRVYTGSSDLLVDDAVELELRRKYIRI